MFLDDPLLISLWRSSVKPARKFKSSLNTAHCLTTLVLLMITTVCHYLHILIAAGLHHGLLWLPAKKQRSSKGRDKMSRSNKRTDGTTKNRKQRKLLYIVIIKHIKYWFINKVNKIFSNIIYFKSHKYVKSFCHHVY